MFAFAFGLLEAGDFKGADTMFADFLEETRYDPSATLRATVTLARKLLNTPILGLDSPPGADKIVATVVKSVINANVPA